MPCWPWWLWRVRRCDRRRSARSVRNAATDAGSPVSSRVPSANTSVNADSVWYAVLVRAAAHAAGVVGDDAADHGSVDRRRVGADLALERRQRRVGLRPITPGWRRMRSPPSSTSTPGPVPRGEHEHRVADRLARQAGAGGAEGDRNAECVRFAQDQRDLVERLGLDHDLGDQAVEAGVGAVGEGAGGVGDASGGVDRHGIASAGQPIEQRGVRSVGAGSSATVGRAISSTRPCIRRRRTPRPR